jgi:predicted transcriptional regulator of viral defense system
MTKSRHVCSTPVEIPNKTSANMDNCLDFVWAGEMNRQANRILELARSKGVLRTRDVDNAGASRALLAALTDEGKLLKLGRGLHALPDRAASAYDSFAEVAARSESGVLCLLSALRFHDLTTQQSSEVWLAIPHKAHAPRYDYPPLRVIRMSGPAMT